MTDMVWTTLAALDLSALLIALCYMAKRVGEELRAEREKREGMRNVRALPAGEPTDQPGMRRVYRRRNMHEVGERSDNR